MYRMLSTSELSHSTVASIPATPDFLCWQGELTTYNIRRLFANVGEGNRGPGEPGYKPEPELELQLETQTQRRRKGVPTLFTPHCHSKRPPPTLPCVCLCSPAARARGLCCRRVGGAWACLTACSRAPSRLRAAAHESFLLQRVRLRPRCRAQGRGGGDSCRSGAWCVARSADTCNTRACSAASGKMKMGCGAGGTATDKVTS